MNMDGIRFSEYAEKCCADLSASLLPSDRELCSLLQLQQIIEQYEHARAPFTNSHRAGGFVFTFKYNPYSRPPEGTVLEFVDRWSVILADYWNQVPDNNKSGGWLCPSLLTIALMFWLLSSTSSSSLTNYRSITTPVLLRPNWSARNMFGGVCVRFVLRACGNARSMFEQY